MSKNAAILPPNLSPEAAASLRDFWTFYEPEADSLQQEVMRVCLEMPVWGPILRAMSAAQLAEQNQRSLALQRAAIMDGQWEPYLEDLQKQGMQYAQAGVSFASWFELIAAFRDCIRERLVRVAREDLLRADRLSEGMMRWLDLAMGHIGEAYLATKERIIVDQQEAIREISTPVLQVRDRLLIIPIVGLVDTHRARHLTEGLLKAIRERRARGVVMDVTGVPVVDSKVANHLAQACEAARLMGALVVLTGISAEIAQTLVTIGAQLRGVRTEGDLQGGIEEVERFLASGALLSRDGAAESAVG